MQRRTGILSAFTLGTAIVFGAAAMAADMPKEGMYNADYTSFGTSKATAIGESWSPSVLTNNGLWLARGLATT